MSALARLRPDNFTLALVGTVLVASLFPCSGQFAADWGVATQIAIALLFFLHGARLSREAVFAGLTHWRLHLTVFGFTYVVFPILGLATVALPPSVLSPSLGLGILFLCCLPSTVQSSIAFTSIAGGNVPAAICSASASSLIGVFLTPVLVGLLMSAHGGVSLDSIESIVMQLLVPFVAGQLLRPWIGAWALRHKKLLGLVYRGSILMVVYGAFSEAVAHGLWHQLTPESTAVMILLNIVLLGIALTSTTWTARRLGFDHQDEITIVFCG